MSPIRLQLLCAFAGGCLSNAVLFGLWRTADGASSAQQAQPSQHVVEQVAAVTSPAPRVEQPSELDATHAAEHGQDAAPEPAPASVAQAVENGSSAPAGSAVSDVLMQLEAAYRERVAPPAPAQARPAAAADDASAIAQAAPVVPAPPVAEPAPVAPPVASVAALEPRPVAPVAVAPAAIAPVAVAPAASTPPVAALPAFATQDAPPPSVVHYGDVNQNTYVTNVRQGDVYLIQLQQLAMLQYMLGASSGVAAPARHVGGGGHQRTPFPSGITNPDNPWGFQFSPLNLVR